ncbi:hypothetical protein [Cytobacillus sp. NCCP-133]|uniref:hypothetical protein n=1 Tax=Cytobacillus sp. NCCP-133 TaxID=766848 RepID=UPI00223118CF|nr:hypothetical protein [Cytobacillus sp. NCCP-133]GLB60140.1 hypothetical protein NCCP133_22720 [Cytobacillus sp. NCCP-133]
MRVEDYNREVFGSHDVPGTLSEVTVLGYGHQLIEIEAVAPLSEKNYKKSKEA